MRLRLHDDRDSITHKFRVGSQKGYFIVGIYGHEDTCDKTGCVAYCQHGQPGELFIHMMKPPKIDHRAGDPNEGALLSQTWSMLRGLVDAVAVGTSLLLQHGVPIEKIAEKHIATNFAPSGFTGNPAIPNASSILDYIFRWMLLKFRRAEYLERFGVPQGQALAQEAKS